MLGSCFGSLLWYAFDGWTAHVVLH